MLNWMAILKRILGLYKVASLQDLGMALGAPLDSDSLAGGEIPWPILERAVAEKSVSWDWLLAGRGEGAGQGEAERKAGASPDGAAPRVAGRTPPRIETREFARVLLDGEKGESGGDGGNPDQRGIRDLAGAENSEAMLEAELLPRGEAEDVASLVARLKEIRVSMGQEIDRIDRILRGHGRD